MDIARQRLPSIDLCIPTSEDQVKKIPLTFAVFLVAPAFD